MQRLTEKLHFFAVKNKLLLQCLAACFVSSVLLFLDPILIKQGSIDFRVMLDIRPGLYFLIILYPALSMLSFIANGRYALMSLACDCFLLSVECLVLLAALPYLPILIIGYLFVLGGTANSPLLFIVPLALVCVVMIVIIVLLVNAVRRFKNLVDTQRTRWIRILALSATLTFIISLIVNLLILFWIKNCIDHVTSEDANARDEYSQTIQCFKYIVPREYLIREYEWTNDSMSQQRIADAYQKIYNSDLRHDISWFK